MKKALFLFFVVMLSFLSCGKKTLQLPQVAVPGVGPIQNHSEVWVFLKHDTDALKAEINKNNTIGSTHWIINIDKRLPLSEVIPALQMVKIKRAKKSPHSVEGMHTYLSYSDTENKQISLFLIDSIQYIMLKDKELQNIKKLNTVAGSIRFMTDSIQIDHKRIPKERWKYMFFDTSRVKKYQLLFSKDLTYQDYMKYRLEVANKLRNMPIDNVELILQ